MQINEDKLLSYVQADIKAAEQFYETEIQPKLIERYQLYNGDPEYYKQKFKKLFRRSDIVMSDIADTIEWAMPSLMRIFFGGRDVVTITPREAEDEQKAEVLQELINFQIQRQNPGFMIFYKWFKDALIGGLGIVKCYWERDWNTYDKKIVIGFDELQIAEKDPSVEIISVEDLGNGLFNAHLKIKKITRNQPKIENIPPSEFIFSPDALRLEDSPFVAHRKVVTVDYLRRKEKEGVYRNIDKVIEWAGDDLQHDQTLDYYLKPYKKQQITNETEDKARQKVLLYECYTKYDVNDDGLLEDVIITVANNTILRIEENIYHRPPFFAVSPILEPYQIWGKGFADILKDLQSLKTALVNQIIVNIAMNNDYKFAARETAVHIEDLIDDKQIIRVKTNEDIKQAIQPLPIQPLAPWSFNFLEYVEGAKENRTGITRYNQGLDSRSLNKTATGISMIMQAANQRLELIARIFAETGVKDLFRFLVELNQRFIDQQTVIRLLNRPLEIDVTDLTGEMDVIVDAGIGVGTKETVVQNMQMLLQLYPTLLQIGVAAPENVYNAVKKLIEEMGYKNVDAFLQSPQKAMQVAQQLSMQGEVNGLTGETGQTNPGISKGFAG